MAFIVTMATTCNVRMGNSTKMASIVTMASLFFFQFLSGSCSTRLTITNKCSYTVWPAILSATGSSPLSTSGFVLQPGDFKIVPVPPAWSGRLWGRTLCSLDITSTKFSCVTGDCGSTTIECVGGNAAPPVTLVKFTLNGTGGLDFYEVSLVDGFNLPVRVKPRGGRNCRATGCVMDLNLSCPTELKVIRDGDAVACKSVCQAEPCLSSQFFKTACPGAHVHAYTCSSHDYTITFCPPPTPSSSYQEISRGNGGGQPGSSPINVVVAVVVALASVCGLFIACKITIRLSNGDCVFGIGAGTRTGTIQDVTV